MIMNKEINYYKLNKNYQGLYDIKVLHRYSVLDNKYCEETGIYVMQKGYNLGLLDLENVFLLSTDNEKLINGIINIANGNNRHADIHLNDVIYYLNIVNAFGFALYHNHPNNLIYPSEDDYISAKDMKKIAKSLNIIFYGSYILGSNYYCEVNENIRKIITI